MGTTTAADITAGAWVRFPDWEQWRYVQAARHTPFRPDEPRGTGYVHYDAADTPQGRPVFYGMADHNQPCRIVTITPQAVTT